MAPPLLLTFYDLRLACQIPDLSIGKIFSR
jgi:hypothetical protein